MSQVMGKPISKGLQRFYGIVVCGLLGLVLALEISPALAQFSAQPGNQHADEAIPSQFAMATASQLEQQGQIAFTAEQFEQAAVLWQRAVEQYQGQTDEGQTNVLAQARSLSNLSLAQQRLGNWSAAQKSVGLSMQLLQPAEHSGNLTASLATDASVQQRTLAQALTTQGALYFSVGQTRRALEQWQQAETAYAQGADQSGQLRSRINQAQALQKLGRYRLALTLIEAVNQDLEHSSFKSTPLKVAALGRWGEVLRLSGNGELAQAKFEQGLSLAEAQGWSQLRPSLLLNLGYSSEALNLPDAALERYQEAAVVGPSIVQAKAHLAMFRLLMQQERWPEAAQSGSASLEHVASLPLQQSSLYLRLNLIQLLGKLNRQRGALSPSGKHQDLEHSGLPSQPELLDLALNTLAQAQDLGEGQGTAQAMKLLGQLYGDQAHWSQARSWTEQSISLAQGLNAPEILASAQAQLGRILMNQNDTAGAIAAYRAAVDQLDDLRHELVAIDSQGQFSFAEEVEPVYRQLVDLLLREVPGRPLSASRLTQAKAVIESLQTVELENFLKESCAVVPQPTPLAEIDPEAAVFHPVVLGDRLELLVELPNQQLKRYRVDITEAQLEKLVRGLRRTVVIRSRPSFLKRSQRLYDLLIRPVEADLARAGIKTLVFAADGPLQTVPMAVLHNGEHYLIEDYAVALAPRYQLTDAPSLSPAQLEQNFIAGLTQARQGFSPLPQVEQELSHISAHLPQSEILKDEAFTQVALQQHLRETPYPVVHIATHGQFASRAQDTFLLAWDSTVNVKDLDRLLQSPAYSETQALELLVLSACESATGDPQAALGLAGVAFKAGARSTLATMWSVNDEASAAFMDAFYQALKQPGTSRAAAVQAAQRQLLTDPYYAHPYYWAAYTLLGNWW